MSSAATAASASRRRRILRRARLLRWRPPPHALEGRGRADRRGERVRESVYTRIWKQAREIGLSPAQQASPLAARPYDLRHAALSSWLNAGVPPSEVAERAGHSVKVLLSVYAACLDGERAAYNARIQTLLDGEYDDRAAVVTIRSGAGGDDATDFAEMLMRMYLRWAEQHKYPVKVMDTSYAEGAGIKSATFEVDVP